MQSWLPSAPKLAGPAQQAAAGRPAASLQTAETCGKDALFGGPRSGLSCNTTQASITMAETAREQQALRAGVALASMKPWMRSSATLPAIRFMICVRIKEREAGLREHVLLRLQGVRAGVAGCMRVV